MTPKEEARRKRRIEMIRTAERAQIMEWYLKASGGVLPLLQCEDKKAYRGIIAYWLEPAIPGVPNPCLIEEELGGQWTIRVEVLQK